jgi:PAS domain S-box-containing protein
MIGGESPHTAEAYIGAVVALLFAAVLLWRSLQVRRERTKLANMLGLMKALFESGHVPKTQAIPGEGILRANRSFCHMLGYTESELRELGWKKITHPDDREEARIAVAGLIERASENAGDSVTFFVRYKMKDNGYVPAFVSVTYVKSHQCEGILLAEIQQTNEFSRRHSETMELRDISFLEKTMHTEKRGAPLQGN